MKIRRLIALVIAIIISLLCVSVALAYTVPDDTIVYVTPYGEKYHREDCSYLKDSYKSMTIASAERKGYDPCSRCDPNTKTGSYSGSGYSGSATVTKQPSSPSPEPSQSQSNSGGSHDSEYWANKIKELEEKGVEDQTGKAFATTADVFLAFCDIGIIVGVIVLIVLAVKRAFKKRKG